MTGRDLPSDVYLDSSLVVAAIVRGSDHSRASADFCAQLAERGSRVYFSQVLRLELAEAVRRLAADPKRAARLPPDLRREYQLGQWGTNLFVRQRWMDFGVQQLDALLDRFAEAFELPFRPKVWRSSLAVIVDHQLRSLDAIHVATAREYRIRHLATTDDDFSRVTDLRVWLLRDPAAAS